MNQTMIKLQTLSESEMSPFIRTLFGQSSPTPVPTEPKLLDERVGSVEWVTADLSVLPSSLLLPVLKLL